MKRGTGKKIGKIVLLVVLLALVGVIVYAVMVCPVNPTRMKPAKSYEQLRDTVEKKTDIRVPGENLLPWTVTERQLRMDSPSRMAKVSGFAISGTMERGGVTFDAEVSVGVTGVVGRSAALLGQLSLCAHLPVPGPGVLHDPALHRRE